MNEAVEYVARNALTIETDAKAGSPLAKRIIELYLMWRKAPCDPCAYGLLVATVGDYRKTVTSV